MGVAFYGVYVMVKIRLTYPVQEKNDVNERSMVLDHKDIISTDPTHSGLRVKYITEGLNNTKYVEKLEYIEG